MGLVSDTIKNILFFLVFISFVEHFFEGSSYKKYIELFLGALLVLLLAVPLLKTGSLEDYFFKVCDQEIDREIWKDREAGQMFEQMEEKRDSLLSEEPVGIGQEKEENQPEGNAK